MLIAEIVFGLSAIGLAIAADKYGIQILFLPSGLFFLITGFLWRKNIQKGGKR